MQNKKLLSLIVAASFCSVLWAQDFHFTQFNMSPLSLNPAQAGQFEGTARIGGLYRNQYAAVIKKEFSTPSVYADAPVLQGFRKRDWIGVGIGFFTDKSGTSQLERSLVSLGASYHLALNKKGTTYLSVGGQYGSESRGLNKDDIDFYDNMDNGQDVVQSIDYAKVNGEKSSFKDINAGVQLTAQLSKTTDIRVGFAMFHLGEPDYTMYVNQSGQTKIPRRNVVHGQFNLALNDKLTISPTFLFQTMGGSDEIMVQGHAGYLFNPERNIYLDFGLSYRLADALNISPIVGMRYKTLKVGLAYDINTASLANTTARGGWELAASYILRIYKPSVVKPKVLCPRF